MNIVLGNGLSAKIFSLYNRDYFIVGKDNLSTITCLSPFILFHDNYRIKKFFSDINLLGGRVDYTHKTFDILVSVNNNYISSEYLSSDDKQKIIDKKLVDQYSGRALKFSRSIYGEGLFLSCEKNSCLKALDVDLESLFLSLDKIIAPQIFSEELVSKICPENNKVVLSSGREISFNHCVSTIPYDVFCKVVYSDTDIASGDEQLEYLGSTFFEGTESDFGINKIPYENAIVYFPEPSFEFSRVIKRDQKCFCEITGKSDIFSGGKYLERTRIIKKRINKRFKNIMMLGRYAEWNPDILIQDIIRRSSDDRFIMNDIFSMQEVYSAHYFDFSEDLCLVQKNTEKLSLLMLDEIFSLLDCINWKIHKSDRPISREKIKEEWIDIFKYFLTIGINLDIGFGELVDTFFKKSEKLEKERRPAHEG